MGYARPGLGLGSGANQCVNLDKPITFSKPWTPCLQLWTHGVAEGTNDFVNTYKMLSKDQGENMDIATFSKDTDGGNLVLPIPGSISSRVRTRGQRQDAPGGQ